VGSLTTPSYPRIWAPRGASCIVNNGGFLATMVTAEKIAKGHTVTVRFTGWGRLGEALAEVDDKPLFTFGGIPGEEAVVEITGVHRRYLVGRVAEVVEASPYRVSAPCAYAGSCTGCQWQHVDYNHQLELKRLAVTDALGRVGGLHDVPVKDTLPSPSPWGYRNHARFTVNKLGRVGYVNRESRAFVEVDHCMLMHPWINGALRQLQGKSGETTQVSVRYGVNSGDYLIQPTFQHEGIALETGRSHYTERLLGRDFRVASPSFFQVNTHQAEQMVGIVRDALQLTGKEVLVDAYAGVGCFAVLLAPYVKEAIAIEESAPAVKDGRENASDVENFRFLRGKTEEVLGDMDPPDAVILDPPRTGCHEDVLEALCKLAPPRVVYVSCDPATLARDLKVLVAGPFAIESVQPVDMFPQTYHVECIVSLALRDQASASASTITLASQSPRRRQILRDMGMRFAIADPSIDEESVVGQTPEQQASARALAKAEAVAQRESGTVVGADTVVVDGDDALGKPHSPSDAEAMLRRLRGGTHRVITAVAVVDVDNGRTAVRSRETTVKMRDYSDSEIQRFVGAGGAVDKAGAYAIQDEVFHPAESIDGCYLNVVGLPPCTVVDLLREVGVEPKLNEKWRPPAECGSCPLAEREA